MSLIDRLRKLITRNRYVVTSLWDDQYAATDLTANDILQMRRQVEWALRNSVPPIEGFIHQSEKGAYFVPVSPHCAPVRIESARKMPPSVVSREMNGEYQVEFGYVPPVGSALSEAARAAAESAVENCIAAKHPERKSMP